MASTTSSTASKSIVVLGASVSGIPLTHYLLAELPVAYTVILVSPSDHLFFNIATPRTMTSHDALDEKRLFLPFLPHLAHLPLSRFQFIQGRAVSVNPETSSVVVKTMSDSDSTDNGEGTEMTLPFAHLVVATGSSAADGWAFKSSEPMPATLARLQATQARVRRANTIVLSGAGTTGVEMAGELACAHPNKRIILVSAAASAIPGHRADIGATALHKLHELRVDVRLRTRVVRYDEAAQTVELSSEGGRVKSVIEGVGLHVPTHGAFPNSGFMPKELLDEHGWVRTNTEMRVSGTANVWALGDVTTFERKHQFNATDMVPVAAHNLLKAVGAVNKERADWMQWSGPKNQLGVVIGNRFGSAVGYIWGWWLPGWLLYLAKGRGYFLWTAPGLAAGKLPG